MHSEWFSALQSSNIVRCSVKCAEFEAGILFGEYSLRGLLWDFACCNCVCMESVHLTWVIMRRVLNMYRPMAAFVHPEVTVCSDRALESSYEPSFLKTRFVQHIEEIETES